MPRSTAAQKQPQTQAKTRPVRSTRKDLETSDQKIGQDRIRAMRPRGPARQALDPTIVHPVERVVSKEKLDALAFMEEVLTITVHDTNDPLAEPYPEVWNGGVIQRFQRGVEQKVKRKYVEVLARAKKTTFGNEKYKDANGDDAYRHPSHTALKYPFAVLHDPSGDKGRAWLKNVLAEG